MKRLIVFMITVLLLITLFGCGTDVTNDRDTDDPVDYSAMPENVAKVRKSADTALTAKYGFDDFSNCKINIENDPETQSDIVSYNLEIFEYSTPEKYSVKVNSDGEVDSVNGYRAGEFSCFIANVTEKDIKKAEKALDEKLRWGDEPKYFFVVDDNGDLYLKFYKIYEMEFIMADGSHVRKNEEVSHQELVCKKP